MWAWPPSESLAGNGRWFSIRSRSKRCRHTKLRTPLGSWTGSGRSVATSVRRSPPCAAQICGVTRHVRHGERRGPVATGRAGAAVPRPVVGAGRAAGTATTPPAEEALFVRLVALWTEHLDEDPAALGTHGGNPVATWEHVDETAETGPDRRGPQVAVGVAEDDGPRVCGGGHDVAPPPGARVDPCRGGVGRPLVQVEHG